MKNGDWLNEKLGLETFFLATTLGGVGNRGWCRGGVGVTSCRITSHLKSIPMSKQFHKQVVKILKCHDTKPNTNNSYRTLYPLLLFQNGLQ